MASAQESRNTAIGNESKAIGRSSTALGDNAAAEGLRSVAAGTNSIAKGENGVAIGYQSKANAKDSVAIGRASVATEENTVSFGNADYQRRLTNIADGGVYSGSTDTVTGNQLWNAYQRMDDLQESINIVGAHAAALSGLHPIQYDPDMPTTLSAAVGTYRDEYAVAVGVFHYARENVMFNLGASICSDGDLMGRAGVSFAVGKGGEKSKKRAKDAASMQKRMDEMEAMLTKLMEENEQNKQTIIELTSQLEEKN